MKRHRFDPLSFLFGIAFVALAALLTVDTLDVTATALRWGGAVLLLVAGTVMLLGSRERNR